MARRVPITSKSHARPTSRRMIPKEHDPNSTTVSSRLGAAAMNRKSMVKMGITTAVLAISAATAIAAQDRSALKVPGGLALADFKGYENWQVVAASQDGGLLA